MENMWYWILGLYFVPMVVNMAFMYFDTDGVETIGDFLSAWWAYFIPFLNLFMTLCIPIYYIDTQLKFGERWEKFKNIKIR
jgi:hypothetical protein